MVRLVTLVGTFTLWAQGPGTISTLVVAANCTHPDLHAAQLAHYGSLVTSPAPVELPGVVAGLGRRIAAISIDWVASLLVASVIVPGLRPWSDNASFPILLVFFAEVTLFTWIFASSFGQRLLRIEVVDLFGARLSLWRIALRTLLICLVVPAVILNSQGRGLHDRAVGSVALLQRSNQSSGR